MFRVCEQAGHEVSGATAGCGVSGDHNTCGFIDSAKSEAIDNILRHGPAEGPGAGGQDPGDGLSVSAVFRTRLPEGAAGGGRRSRHRQLLRRLPRGRSRSLAGGPRKSSFGAIDAPAGRSRAGSSPHRRTTRTSKSPRAATTAAPTASFRPSGAGYRSRNLDDVLYESPAAGRQRREGADRGGPGYHLATVTDLHGPQAAARRTLLRRAVSASTVSTGSGFITCTLTRSTTS